MANSKGKVRLAAYCRVGREEQLVSIQAEKKFCQEYAFRHNLELEGLYVDEGVSGSSNPMNRKEFQRMISDAQGGKFECVYIKDASRLSRNANDFHESIKELKALNIDCHFMMENLSSYDSELSLTILKAVQQEELARRSQKTKLRESAI